MYNDFGLYEIDSPLLPRDTGIYVRLSDEEKEKNLSDSISNQKMILLDYAKELQLNVVNIYADNHHTGSTFNRPVFKKMIEDIEKGIINCVLIKDLSRFGREHVGAGYYLEKYFPQKGVRFLTYNKKLDSYLDPSRMGEIDIPFENLLNEQTVKHTSAVTKASLRVKRKDGLFVGSVAPYGYNRSVDNRHLLVVDENTYRTVQYIFNEYISLIPMAKIAKELNEQAILSPSSYRNQQNGKPIKTTSKWTANTIRRILAQEIYTGNMVQGKTYSYNHKIKKRFPLPRSKWDIIENTHERIIDISVFETTSELLEKNMRQLSNNKNNISSSIFAGLLQCSECGQSLTRNSWISNNNKTYNRFICSTYKKKGRKACSSHLINEDELSRLVLKTLNTFINNLCDAENSMKKEALLNQKNTLADLTKNVQKAISNRNGVIEKKHCLYSDYKDDILTRDEYDYMKHEFEIGISKLDKEIKTIETKINDINDGCIPNNKYINLFKSFKGIVKLDRLLLIKVIDLIVIDKDMNIKINFKFQDPIKKYLSH